MEYNNSKPIEARSSAGGHEQSRRPGGAQEISQQLVVAPRDTIDEESMLGDDE